MQKGSDLLNLVRYSISHRIFSLSPLDIGMWHLIPCRTGSCEVVWSMVFIFIFIISTYNKKHYSWQTKHVLYTFFSQILPIRISVSGW